MTSQLSNFSMSVVLQFLKEVLSVKILLYRRRTLVLRKEIKWSQLMSVIFNPRTYTVWSFAYRNPPTEFIQATSNLEFRKANYKLNFLNKIVGIFGISGISVHEFW